MGKDLMYQDEIRNAVRDAYGSIASGAGEVVASMLYSEEELAELPSGGATGPSGSATPSDTRSSSRARSSSTSGPAEGSTRSSPRVASDPPGGRSASTSWGR